MKHNYIFRGWWRWMNRIAIPKIKHAGYKYKKIDSNSAELQILVYDMSEQDASSLDYGLELSDNNRGNYKGFEQVSQNNIKENLMKQDRMQLLENKLRKLVQAEIAKKNLNEGMDSETLDPILDDARTAIFNMQTKGGYSYAGRKLAAICLEKIDAARTALTEYLKGNAKI